MSDKNDDILNESGDNADDVIESAETEDTVSGGVEESESSSENTMDTKVKEEPVKTKAAVSNKGRSKKPPKNKQSPVVTWFKEVKSEFSKIIWPNKKELTKMTITVIVTALIFGIVISGFDVISGVIMGLLVDLF